MEQLIATYGVQALAWVLTALGGLLAAHVFRQMRQGYVRDVLQRAWTEVQGAVMEIGQTYADAIRDATAGGKLTPSEKAQAKAMAVEAAKANLGKKGLERLSRVLGMGSTEVDRWLASKTEQAVATVKAATATAKGSGVPVPIPR